MPDPAEDCRPDAKVTATVAAVLAHPTRQAAAEALGIAPRTLYERLRRQEYADELRRQASELSEQLAYRHTGALDMVLDAATTMAADESKPDTVRLAAMRVVADLLPRLASVAVLGRTQRAEEALEASLTDDNVLPFAR